MYSDYPYKIILASASPRRQELLKLLGFNFDVEIKSIDEEIIENLSPTEVALDIAIKKSEAFNIENYDKNTLIITADTVVAVDNKILGKPKNAKEAFEMLNQLSDKTHEVITGICIKTNDFTDIFSSKTYVTFCKISKSEINYYIEHYKPFDKAGSYGIQEWIGLGFISSINGSYTNVVGLPTDLILRKLKGYLM